MSKKVFFYFVPRETATKVHNFSTSDGRSLNKIKVGKHVGNVYRALKSASTGKLKTGLDVIVDNPYKEHSKENIKPGFEPYLLNKNEVKLQHLLEYKHNVDVNYYTDSAPNEVAYKHGDTDETLSLPYFQQRETKATITDTGLVLDLDKPEDEIKYYFLKASSKCAPSREKARAGIHEFYIGFENEDEEQTYNKSQLVDKAIYMLMNPEFTDQDKLRLAKYLDLVSRDTSPKRVHTVLRTYIVEKHKDQSTRVKKFINTINSLETPESRERFNATVILNDLVNYYIVTVKQGIYTWKDTGLEIGVNKSEAVNFLLNPKKQAEQDELNSKLEYKKSNS